MGKRLYEWPDLQELCEWDTLIVGNGLSINIWRDFAYPRLFARAHLNSSAARLFSDFKTENFETVLEALWHADTTLKALRQDNTDVAALYEHVQSALFQAVHDVHVPWKLIDQATLTKIADALKKHRLVFTLNYDLLTYWAAMASGPMSMIRDLFWSHHNTFDINNATLDEHGGTGLLYLHGGLHLWQDSQSGLTGKWTSRAGGALLKNLEANFASIPSRQPVLVSEGTSARKMARIRRSDYLAHALQMLSDNTSDTVIFGANFGDEDAHVFRAVDAGRNRRIAISIRPGAAVDDRSAMARYSLRFPGHELLFFDSTTHPLGDRSFTVTNADGAQVK
jgi:hypothetical protein